MNTKNHLSKQLPVVKPEIQHKAFSFKNKYFEESTGKA